jgi:adenosylmethionine-8-amino-7-oxononanoate aminotransferase
MNLDSNDYLEDYTTNQFKQKAQQAIQQQTQDAQAKRKVEQRKMEADASLAEANVGYTNAQAKNTMDDNARQLAVSIDRHFQEWADLTVKATKEGAELPEHPGYDQIIMLARQIITQG